MFCGLFGSAMDERTNDNNFGVFQKLKRALTKELLFNFFKLYTVI